LCVRTEANLACSDHASNGTRPIDDQIPVIAAVRFVGAMLILSSTFISCRDRPLLAERGQAGTPMLIVAR
jgi:hypothetical protein